MSNISKLNDWLQVIGMFGLIASLLFVGLQIRQDHEIALSAIYQSRSDTTVNSSLAAINSPAFLDASAKLYANKPDDLTLQEAIAWEYYIGANITAIESNHQQYLLGFLSEEHWQRNIEELQCMLDLSINRENLRNWNFRASFKKVLDELTAQAIEDQNGCWDLNFEAPYPVQD